MTNQDTNVASVLAERGTTHGPFKDNAAISCGLKDVFRSSPNWNTLTAVQQEALDLIATKISRVLSGDPDHVDNYTDIAGYAVLVAKSIAVPHA